MEFKFLKLCLSTKGTQKQRLKNLKNFYESFSSLIDPHINNNESFFNAIKANNLLIAKWLFYDIGGFKIKSILKKSFQISKINDYKDICDWLKEIDYDDILDDITRTKSINSTTI